MNEKNAISLRLNKELYAKIKILSKKMGISINAFITLILHNGMQNQGDSSDLK